MKKSKASPMKLKKAPIKKSLVAIKQKVEPKKAAQKLKPMPTVDLGIVHHHDILQMIMDDHKPLKRLLNILKNLEMSLNSRRSAFNEFAPLLTIHAKAEENVLYTFIKKEAEMRTEAFEGDVEHALAEQIIADLKETVDKDIWSAKAKVLAELVEHHLNEEEDELFPDLKKHLEALDLIRLGEDYLSEKDKIKMEVLHPKVQRREVTQTVRH